MANLRHDRVPEQTLTQGSALETHGPALNGNPVSTRRILLSVLLWTQGSAGAPAPVSANSPLAGVSLVVDLVTASGGAPQPAAGGLSASFFNVQSALLTARRIQSALSGLAESGTSQHVATAVLIYSVEDPALVDPNALLQAAPGQVLLSRSVADAVQPIPNAQLSDSVFAGWRNLEWRSPGGASSYATDEQAVLRLIREQGRQDPCAPRPEIAQPVASSTAIPSWSAPIGTRTATYALTDDEQRPALNPKWWIIGGGAAAAIVIAVVIALTFPGHKAPPPAPPPVVDTTVKTSAPETHGTSAAGDKPASPGATNPKQSNPKASKIPKIEPGKPSIAGGEVSRENTGHCDFTEAEIPRSLSRAESFLYAGRLDEAQALYQHLLGCPAAHQKAQEGLQRVKQRKEANTSGL